MTREQVRPDTSGTTRDRTAWFVIIMTSCVVLAGVSVQFVDRPVASWVHEYLVPSPSVWLTMPSGHHVLKIDPFSLMIGPAELFRPLALVVLPVVVLAAAAGWRAGPRWRLALALSLSILVAMSINQAAQSVFGRTWPESRMGDNPSWIGGGVFGFFPFHGGAGWESFPSDHTAITTAAASLLWIVLPKLRLLWLLVVVIDVGGLIGGNYHFVSDIVGGIYLGIAVGRGTAALLAPWGLRT